MTFFVIVCVRYDVCNAYVLFFQDVMSTTNEEEQVECDNPSGEKLSTLRGASAAWQRY